MSHTTNLASSSSSPWCWTSVHDQYKTVEILGQGTYGVVYKAEHKATGELVAMKRCRLDAFREFGIPETTLREIALLRDLRHENIMTLFHVSCNTERLYLICEYLDLDLKKYIRSRPKGIPLRKVKEVTYELFKGLAYCHGHRVIHRDLKPHNVLVSSDLSKVKIADFGLARSSLAPGKTLTHEVITLWYRAPELLLGHCNYSSGVDIWSVGCIIAELLSSKPLYVGDSEIDTLFKIFRLLGTPKEEDWPEHAVVPWDDFPAFSGSSDPFHNLTPEGLDDEGKDLLNRIFKYNSEERISALESLHHPWLDEVREAAIAAGEEVSKPEWMEWESMDAQSTVPTTPNDNDNTLKKSIDEEERHAKKKIKSKDLVDGFLGRNDDESDCHGRRERETTKEIVELERAKTEEQNYDRTRRQETCPINGYLPNRSDRITPHDIQETEMLKGDTGFQQQSSKYHDVAKMAQRMKELEEKLREVERQRIEPSKIQFHGQRSPQHPTLVARVDPSTGVPTRTTTATSSPAARDQQRKQQFEISEDNQIDKISRNNLGDGSTNEQDMARIPCDSSAARRHKFGVRRKTIEADEILIKKKKEERLQQRPISTRWGMRSSNSTSCTDGSSKGGISVRGNQPLQNGGGGGVAGKSKGTGLELMGKWRRSSFGNLFERARRKDPQHQHNQQQHSKPEVRGGNGKIHRNGQIHRDSTQNDVKKIALEQPQLGRYGRQATHQAQLQHEYSIASIKSESLDQLRSSSKQVVPQPPRYSLHPHSLSGSSISESYRHSLPPPPAPPHQENWRHWTHRNSYDGSIKGLYDESFRGNNDYRNDTYDAQKQQQHYKQPIRRQHSQTAYNKQLHPFQQQGFHPNAHQNKNLYQMNDCRKGTKEQTGRMKIVSSESALRNGLHSSDSYYVNCPPHPSSAVSQGGSSSRNLTSSFAATAAGGGPVQPSNASSFWGGRDLALDVECSLNWTTGQDDTNRQHSRGPSFQPSTNQGMMFSSNDRWKRSSNYGHSTAKESITRLNLKLAANASLVATNSNSITHRMPSHYVNQSRQQNRDSGGPLCDPGSGSYFYEGSTIHDSTLRRSVSRSSLNGQQQNENRYDPTIGQHWTKFSTASSKQSTTELSDRRYHDPCDIQSLRRHTIEVASVTRR